VTFRRVNKGEFNFTLYHIPLHSKHLLLCPQLSTGFHKICDLNVYSIHIEKRTLELFTNEEEYKRDEQVGFGCVRVIPAPDKDAPIRV
jgi:hypothetical protein